MFTGFSWWQHTQIIIYTNNKAYYIHTFYTVWDKQSLNMCRAQERLFERSINASSSTCNSDHCQQCVIKWNNERKWFICGDNGMHRQQRTQHNMSIWPDAQVIFHAQINKRQTGEDGLTGREGDLSQLCLRWHGAKRHKQVSAVGYLPKIWYWIQIWSIWCSNWLLEPWNASLTSSGRLD